MHIETEVRLASHTVAIPFFSFSYKLGRSQFNVGIFCHNPYSFILLSREG